MADRDGDPRVNKWVKSQLYGGLGSLRVTWYYYCSVVVWPQSKTEADFCSRLSIDTLPFLPLWLSRLNCEFLGRQVRGDNSVHEDPVPRDDAPFVTGFKRRRQLTDLSFVTLCLPRRTADSELWLLPDAEHLEVLVEVDAPLTGGHLDIKAEKHLGDEKLHLTPCQV